MQDQKYLAFDIETTKPFPEGEDWKEHRPLGIACAAAYSEDLGRPITWHTDGKDGIQSQMSVTDLRILVATLRSITERGYTIVTWNGLGFDFDILAEESGLFQECKELTMSHVDMMFHFFAEKGYPLSLAAAAEGMNTPGKTEGMDGLLATQMWAEGNRQPVIDYCAQDVISTYELANVCQQKRHLSWTSRTGRHQSLFLPTGWQTVAQAVKIPPPDTSWMTDPIPRDQFTRWMTGPPSQQAPEPQSSDPQLPDRQEPQPAPNPR